MTLKWFRKKVKRSQPLPAFLSRMFVQGNNALLRFAGWLSKKTTPYSAQKKKAVLLFFCAACGLESLYVSWNGFQKKAKPAYTVEGIHVIPLLKEDKRTSVEIPELGRVHRYAVYLDSLRGSAAGRKLRDSLLFLHPHLLDTLQYLDGLYREQSKRQENGNENQ